MLKETLKHISLLALAGSAFAMGIYALDENTALPAKLEAKVPVLRGTIEKTADVGQSLTQMGLQSVDQIAANLHLSNSQANAQNTEAKVKLAQIERKIAEDQLQSELLNHELAKLNQDKQTFDKMVHPMKRLLPDAVSQGYNFMAQKVPLPPFPNAIESESPLLQTEANKKACSCP